MPSLLGKVAAKLTDEDDRRELRRLAAARSPSGENNTQLFSYTLRSLRYFSKAEATAKAKYERLVKFVDFYS